MAELVTTDLKHHILQYLSSGPAGPEKAIQNMTSKFGMKKLIRPVLLARLKEMITAKDNSQIPAKAEEILTILESLAQMEPETVQTLPQDVLVHIFRALRLTTIEQRDVIGMITKDFTTIEEVRKYVTDRMLFFSMWERTFRKSELDYKASLSRDNQSGRTHAAGALGGASEGGDKKPRFQGRNKKKLGGREEVNQSSDKSFGGASFGGKTETKVSNTKKQKCRCPATLSTL